MRGSRDPAARRSLHAMVLTLGPRDLMRAVLAVLALWLAYAVVGGARLRFLRWCAFYPTKCYQLHGAGWVGGRASMALGEVRQLLLLGTMGAGTTSTAVHLSMLGLEIAHESSDTLIERARDGTSSWAHAIRFLRVAPPRRDAVVTRLCARARHGAWHHIMFDGGRFGGGFECATRTNPPWDACWEAECMRVVGRELGCALADPANCASPFGRTLLQVRHPLRTLESNVVSFCRGRDTLDAARESIQLDTYDVLIPAPPRREGTNHSECSRQFGWWWVHYIRLLRPHAHAIFRVEDTSPCAILALGGVLPHPPPAPLPESAVPRHIARRAQQHCAAAPPSNASSRTAHHGVFNHRNGARGQRPFRLTYASLRAVDPALYRAMRTLAAELGYEEGRRH